MNRRLCALLAAALLLCTLCGCSNYSELNELSIVTGFALSRGTGKAFRITAEILGDGDSKNASPPVTVTSEGDSVFDCVSGLVPPSGKPLYFSHCKIAILTEDAAAAVLPSLLDWCARDGDVRLTMLLFLTGEEDVAALFPGADYSGDSYSFDLYSAARSDLPHAGVAAVTVHSFLEAAAGEGTCAFLPILTREGIAAFGADSGAQALTFFQNGAPAGSITKDELTAFELISGRFKKGSLTLQTEEQVSSMRLKKKKSREEIALANGRLSLSLDYRFTANLTELSYPFNPYDKAEMAELEQRAGAWIADGLASFFSEAQARFGFDIFGLGAALRRSDPAGYDAVRGRWDALFCALQPSFSAEVSVDDTGLTSRSLSIPLERGTHT